MTAEPIKRDADRPPIVFGLTNRHVKRAMDAYALGSVVWRMGQAAYKWVDNHDRYRVSVDETDDLYPAVHGWLMSRVPTEDRKSLHVRSRRVRKKRRGNGDEPDALISSVDANRAPVPERDPADFPLALLYDGKVTLSVTVAGHPCRVFVERDENPPSQYERRRPETIVFSTRGHGAREDVLAFLAGLVEPDIEPLPRLYIGGRWGDWHRHGELQERPLDTVVMDAGVQDAIIHDLDVFLGSEGEYARLGWPWHRGYLFHGPPGTGKTSTAMSIASHFGLDVYLLPVGDIADDNTLIRLVAGVPQRAMLLLEDVDVVDSARRDKPPEGGVTAVGLLNSLDGVATPHGLVTVLTTNHVDRLDPALTRAGRADMHVHVDYLDPQTGRRLAARVTGRPWGAFTAMDWPAGAHVSASDIVEAAKVHVGYPDAMADAILAWCKEQFG